MEDLVRYSLIKEKLKREFLLLQGKGCAWKKCTYCDYYNDVSDNPFEINKKVIEKVTGETGVIDVINSGSIIELDADTLDALYEKIKEKHIHTMWCEAHWIYRNKLAGFASRFPGVNVKFRTGIETFNPELRKSWNKGIPEDVTAEEVAKYFKGVCLLLGIKGQTKEIIKSDIELALKYFEYFSVNIFVENTTDVKRDAQLVDWFKSDIYPNICDNDRVEVLFENTDLGVG